MITAGIDIGTRLIKACLVEDSGIIASSLAQPGRDMTAAIRGMYDEMLRAAGVKGRHVKKIISTGYGAGLVKMAGYTLSDEACIARAVHVLAPGVGIAVDAGGLFIRVARISERGFLDDSIVNEPCAAGSGKFLELVCEAAGISVEQAGAFSARSSEPYRMKSACAVFAESEVISELNRGRQAQDIVAGVIDSIASKTFSLLSRSGFKAENIFMSGGMAIVGEYVRMTEELAGVSLRIPDIDPRLVPAFGAALMARQSLLQR